VDYSSLERQKAIDWVITRWGRERVASIITFGTFKPKSTVKDYFRVTAPEPLYEGDLLTNTAEVEQQNKLFHEIYQAIPDSTFGRESTLKEIIEGNEEKGYEPHPELLKPEYEGWYKTASQIEGMVRNFGVHAAGLIISDQPISDNIPIWCKTDKELQPNGTTISIDKWVTQWDMKETEQLGLIKFDFLGIDNLSILKETCRLIKQTKNLDIDMYSIEDGDPKTYSLLASGLLSGVFQFETGGRARDLLQILHPNSIEELADITSLNRPGPLQMGLDQVYIENKANGFAPSGMPDQVAKILDKTYWTLIYQEQVIKLCSELGNFTMREGDEIRRALGKKKLEVLAPYKTQFIDGCIAKDLTKAYAIDLWDTLEKFSDYSFCQAHAVIKNVSYP